MHRLSHTKKVVFVKFQRSTEISKAIFLLHNPAVCLYTSHSEKRVKGKSLRSLSVKWRVSFVTVGPDDVSVICMPRASSL